MENARSMNKSFFLWAMIAAGGILTQPVYFIATALAAVILLSFFIFPQFVISLLLISRSSLDIFTDIGLRIGPVILNIPSITSLFLLAGGGSYLFLEISVRKNIVLDRIGKVFLLWLLFLVPSVIFSYSNFGQEGLVGLREWIRLSSLFLIYALVYTMSARVGYRKIINFIFWALPVPLLTGFYQIVTSGGLKIDKVSRAYGTFVHPNSLSLFLVLFIGLTAWKIRFTKNRGFWLMLLAAELLLLINTFSLGGMIMFLVMSSVLLMKTLKAKYRLTILIFAIITFTYFASTPFGQQRINEISRTGNILEILQTGRLSGTGSMAWRLLSWHLFLKEWMLSPFLGHGLATTGELVSPMKNVPHNDYLRFLVETGVLGFTFFMYLMVALGKAVWRLYRASLAINPEFSYLAVIGFSVYAAWAVGSFADNFITATGFQYYFWALLGALMGDKRYLRACRLSACLGGKK